MKRRGLVAALVLAGSSIAWIAFDAHAQSSATTGGSTVAASTVTTGPAPSPLFGLMQGLVGLVIVIGLIFAAGWLMKKIGPRTRAGGLVQVVGGTSIGPREKVVVVRFAGRTLLLGVAPGQVSLLHAADTVDVVDDVASSGSPGTPTFVDRLRAARGGA